MAVDDHLPVLVPLLATSFSSFSSSSVTRRRHFVQVATNNSSAFISFPINSRKSSAFVPTYRSRTSLSTARPFSRTTNTQSVSDNSKSSNTHSSSIVSADHERKRSQQRCNPILNNSLLNHRKEQPKSFPVKTSIDYSQTTRLCLSSTPLKPTSNDQQISTVRVSTPPLVAHQSESSISDKEIIPDDDDDDDDDENNEQQEIYRLDKNRYDYITRWLHAVVQANYAKETMSKTKRSKNRYTHP